MVLVLRFAAAERCAAFEYVGECIPATWDLLRSFGALLVDGDVVEMAASFGFDGRLDEAFFLVALCLT